MCASAVAAQLCTDWQVGDTGVRSHSGYGRFLFCREILQHDEYLSCPFLDRVADVIPTLGIIMRMCIALYTEQW